jgi:hypothetical protein
MRKFIFFLLVLFPLGLSSQNLQGDWLLAYIVSTPPEMTIDEDGVDLAMGDKEAEAESFVEQGLMILSVLSNGKATSDYADVRENWKVVQEGRNVRFESKADTLYGNLNDEGLLQLRSVIDQFPTEYYFTTYAPKAMKLDLSNTRWKVEANNVLDGKTLEFKSDSELRIWTDGKSQLTDYFLIPLGDYYAIELSSGEFQSGFVIIYIENLTGEALSGVMYVVAPDDAPKRVKIQLNKL